MLFQALVTVVRVAPLVGAWIEIHFLLLYIPQQLRRSPRGSVDRNMIAITTDTKGEKVAPLVGAWIEIVAEPPL